MGGVTAVFEMPNTKPETTTPEALADKIRRGTDRMHCDFAFWVGGTHENIGELRDLERLPGAAGIKVFMGSSTGSLLVEDDAGVAAVLRQTRRRAAFHSEDEEMLRARKDLRVAGDPTLAPGLALARRPPCGAPSGWCAIAHETGARIHVLHISTAEEMVFLAGHKDVATVEATPHHLTLAGARLPIAASARWRR